MSCYICGCSKSKIRNGVVRDAPGLTIFECPECGLVWLSEMEHVKLDHYESSGMHGPEPIDIDSWLTETFEDDQRRFAMLEAEIKGNRILDFGSGACGFVKMASNIASQAIGIELERRVRSYWGESLSIYPSISFLEKADFQLISLFHVLEHLKDPRSILSELKGLLAKQGKIIIEVPNSEDALLTLYECEEFSKFIYWSQHFWIFNAKNLKILSEQAGFKTVELKYVQRYPPSNHLHWLSQGKPGGHIKWNFLDDQDFNSAYANTLARIGKTDTLIAILEKND